MCVSSFVGALHLDRRVLQVPVELAAPTLTTLKNRGVGDFDLNVNFGAMPPPLPFRQWRRSIRLAKLVSLLVQEK